MQKDITVCSPNMDIVTLPEGSTALDFAFFLNTTLAAKTSEVKVNGVIKTMNTKLKDMDIVEIIVKNQITIKTSWLNYVQSSKAIKEINRIASN
ncbi:TGS domain-containing protein [Bacillus spongiae]|uniref:TGS domain-containing protein n=1 Tax=Bacillus spongiae TaxID=2683610 RepID=A0ABU8HJZ0_9BACI